MVFIKNTSNPDFLIMILLSSTQEKACSYKICLFGLLIRSIRFLAVFIILSWISSTDSFCIRTLKARNNVSSY